MHINAGMTMTFEEIAARAYARFVQRGYQHGHDVEDWLAAEAEVRGDTMPARSQKNAKARTTRAPKSSKR